MIPRDLQRTPRRITGDAELIAARATNDQTYSGTTSFQWTPSSSGIGDGTFTPGLVEWSQAGTGEADAVFHYNVSGLTNGATLTFWLLTHPGAYTSGDYFGYPSFVVDSNGAHTANVHYGNYGTLLGGSFSLYTSGHTHDMANVTLDRTAVPGMAATLTPGTWRFRAEIVHRGDSEEAETSLDTAILIGTTPLDTHRTTSALPFDGYTNQVRVEDGMAIVTDEASLTVAARGGLSTEDAVTISRASTIIAVKVA